MMAFAKLAITLLLPLSLPCLALANTPPAFSLDGTLYDSPAGTAPLRDNAVRIRVQILPPTGSCVLYDEEQTVDTSASDGAFSIQVGSGTGSAKRVAGSDAGNTMITVFQNKAAITGAAACSYTPALGAARRARVIITPSGGPADQLTPDLVLSSVPNALVADTLQGVAPEGFLRLNTGTLTQANVENVFSPTKYSILDALLAGTGVASSGSYTIDAGTSGSGGIDFNTNGSTKASLASNGNFNVDSGSFFVDAASNRVGIGTSAPAASLDLSAKSDAVILPKGDASQRPSPAAEGMLRFNSVSKQLESYNGTSWVSAENPWTSATGGINYAGGKVGIGTSAPNHYLDVRAPHYEIARFKNGATSGDRSALFELENGNTTPSRWSFTVGGTGNGAALAAGEFYIEKYGLGPVMTFNGSGQVGIGTKTPSTNLHVAGNGDTSIRIDSGAASRAAQIEINRGGGLDSWIGPSGANSFDMATAEAIPFTFSNDNYKERLRITNDGRIGVGTAAPSGKFSVGSAAGEDAYFFRDNADLASNADGQSLYVYRKDAGGSGDSYLRFYNDQYRQSHITHSGNGNLFINTSSLYMTLPSPWAYSPSSTGQYHPNMGAPYLGTNSNQDGIAGGILIRTGNSAWEHQYAYMGAVSTPSGRTPNIVIGAQTGNTSYSERMRIDTNGNVGIGTANPTSALHIASATSASLKFDHIGDHQSDIYDDGDFHINSNGRKLWINDYNNGTVLINAGGGNVAIGTTNAPAYKLDVNGDLRITGTPYRTGGDIAWTNPSDARLKDVLGSYARGLDEIAGINTIRFRYKEGNAAGADSKKEYVGVIAQELEKLFPEAVSKNPSDGYLNVNTTPVFWSLVNAVKELKERSDRAFDQSASSASAQKRELASVLQENQAIKAENQAIKAYLCVKDPLAPFCRK